jgi:hypothetical protein
MRSTCSQLGMVDFLKQAASPSSEAGEAVKV